MTRRAIILIAAVSLFVGMLPAAAQTRGVETDRLRPVPGQGGGSALGSQDRADQLVNVFIQFTTPSVARFTADRLSATGLEPSRGQKLAQADSVANQHQVMRSALSSYIVREQSAQRFAINGLTVWVRAGDIPAISRVPGVLSVMRIVQHYPEHGLSVPAVGAPTVWNDFQFTGEGLRIAIIDSGIDYHHATFGGSGDPADYAADDGLALNEAFPSTKIVGGWDFVGDAYTGSNTPQPDPSPLDCDTGNAGGHGTHVAGTAGGFGVLANGDTFTGTYDADTFNENEFLVGPGVAPDVMLVALRVFGCSGSSGVVHEAIDWVIEWNTNNPEDFIDVINMSLGSSFGEADDPSAIASANAVDAGVIVVAASGNAGNIPYITGSPAITPGVISVAGSIAGGTVEVNALLVKTPLGDPQQNEGYSAWWPHGLSSCTGWRIRNNYDLHPDESLQDTAIRIRSADLSFTYVEALPAGTTWWITDLSDSTEIDLVWNAIGFGNVSLSLTRSVVDCGLAGTYPMTEAAFGTPLAVTGDVHGRVVAGASSIGTAIEGCGPLSNAEDVAGNVVLLRRGTCAFVDKYANAVAAGATALIVYNNTGGPPIAMGGDAEGAIPAVMVADTVGAAMITALGSGDVEVLLSPAITMPLDITPDEPYASSSRGPGRGGSTFKPEVTAPAVNVRSADVGTGTGGVQFSGTSMATPHVAGIAAMLREAHPDADPSVIKSLMMNSGRPLDPATLPITRQAAGVVQADVAVNLGAYTSPGGVAFGRLNPTVAGNVQHEVTVHDLSGDGGTYDISISETGAVGGVTVTAPTSVTVPAGGSQSFTLTLTYDPAAMPEDGAFQSQREAFGRIALVNGEETLSLTYNVVIDPASDVEVLGGNDGFGLVNHSPYQWTPATAYATGDVVFSEGVSGFGVGTYGTVALFGIALDDSWEPLSPVVVDIWIDADQDGFADYLVEAADLGLFTTGAYNGQYASGVFDPNTGSGSVTHYVFADWNDRVLEITAPLSLLPLLTGEFDYYLEVWSIRSGDTLADQFGTVDFSAADDWYFDVEGGDSFDGSELGSAAQAGLMWLMPNNPLVSQVQFSQPADPVAPTVGAFDPATGQWHLRDSEGNVTSFFYGGPGDVPLVGDWNGDGTDTVGVWRNGLVLLRNSNSGGLADIVYWYGAPGDVPIAGDWDGDGTDTVSVYRQSAGRVFISNELGADMSGVVADFSYYFGIGGDKPFAGDWNGDGIDTLGLHRESSGLMYFTNAHVTSIAEFQFYYGIPGDRVIAGDWGVIDLIDTPAVFRPSNTTWYFRHSLTQGFADSEFVWGESGWLPVAGHFGLDD